MIGAGVATPALFTSPKRVLTAKFAADLFCRGLNGGFIGDVEDQWRERISKIRFEPLGICLLADTAEDAISILDQYFYNSQPNACGSSSYDYTFHFMLLVWENYTV